jgi:tetratricopeptide (TPR) repeat protein
VHTVEGNDLFALVDSGTARLVTAFGALGPSGSVADVTTRSVAAYRMYEQGMRAYFRGEIPTAHAFFTAAVAEDPLFALATFQSAITGNTELDSLPARLERARRLAARAPDRERLTILAKWAYSVSSPTLEQLADTLVTRYPTEIEGHLYTGISRFFAGEFLAAITPLERVVAMDSLGVSGTRPTCWSCEAMRTLVSAYELADSASAAERQARRWVRLQPGVPAANALVEVLEAQGRFAEADSVIRAAAPADPSYDDVLTFRALHLIRAGEHDAADRLLRPKTKESGAVTRLEAYWQLAISLREQGKLVEAVDAARHIRALAPLVDRSTPVQPTALEAQIQLDGPSVRRRPPK